LSRSPGSLPGERRATSDVCNVCGVQTLAAIDGTIGLDAKLGGRISGVSWLDVLARLGGAAAGGLTDQAIRGERGR
jgi:hypothetical protein